MRFKFLITSIMTVLLIAVSANLWAQQNSPSSINPASIVNGNAPSGTVTADDHLSSAPLHLPPFESLGDLMQQMKTMHDQSDDRNLALALRAARKVNRLNRGSLHQTLVVDEQAYREYAANLWQKNQTLQKAIESRDRRKIDRAFQDQARSCKACHQQYRKDD